MELILKDNSTTDAYQICGNKLLCGKTMDWGEDGNIVSYNVKCGDAFNNYLWKNNSDFYGFNVLSLTVATVTALYLVLWIKKS